MSDRYKTGAVSVGTSGWSYDWPRFYPDHLAASRRLEYYAGRFGAVEVNYSFYRLPRRSTYQKWAATTPGDFEFVLKLSRYITHIKRLSRVKTATRTFVRRASALGGKLSLVLVQLPPSYAFDGAVLDAFLRAVAELARERHERIRIALEVRHPSWFVGEGARAARTILGRHRAAFVFAHSSRYPYPEDEPLTADFAYLRFHGPGEMFASAYGRRALEPWARKIERWRRGGHDVYAFFNNDVDGHAADDALALASMVG